MFEKLIKEIQDFDKEYPFTDVYTLPILLKQYVRTITIWQRKAEELVNEFDDLDSILENIENDDYDPISDKS